jgi:hypothetical protein
MIRTKWPIRSIGLPLHILIILVTMLSIITLIASPLYAHKHDMLIVVVSTFAFVIIMSTFLLTPTKYDIGSVDIVRYNNTEVDVQSRYIRCSFKCTRIYINEYCPFSIRVGNHGVLRVGRNNRTEFVCYADCDPITRKWKEI